MLTEIVERVVAEQPQHINHMIGGFPEVDHVRRGNTDVGVFRHSLQLADSVERQNRIQPSDEFGFRFQGQNTDYYRIQLHMIYVRGLFQVGFGSPVQSQSDFASSPLEFRDQKQRQIIASAQIRGESVVIDEDFFSRDLHGGERIHFLFLKRLFFRK